jgi:hypothetical protein
MKNQYEIATLFKTLNPEHQKALLACARVSRVAENAVKQQCGRSLKHGTGPEYAVIPYDTQEGGSFYKS